MAVGTLESWKKRFQKKAQPFTPLPKRGVCPAIKRTTFFVAASLAKLIYLVKDSLVNYKYNFGLWMMLRKVLNSAQYLAATKSDETTFDKYYLEGLNNEGFFRILWLKSLHANNRNSFAKLIG